jgi:hypothetical protein
MLAFPEIERAWEEEVVACFKVFLDSRLQGLRKITRNLRIAVVLNLYSYLALP